MHHDYASTHTASSELSSATTHDLTVMLVHAETRITHALTRATEALEAISRLAGS